MKYMLFVLAELVHCQQSKADGAASTTWSLLPTLRTLRSYSPISYASLGLGKGLDTLMQCYSHGILALLKVFFISLGNFLSTKRL